MPKGYSKHNQSGWKHSEESKEKIREKHLGEKHTQDHKDKIGEGLKGKTLGSRNTHWKGDEVGYLGKHKRIYKMKGSAKNYKCIDCNKSAEEWSNINHLYSDNPDDYLPRCIKCHRKYDKKLATLNSVLES
ncbi:MAG: hypothetical protein ACTSSH_00130 [Candidatus Heimdallarchaeota archaeon]